MDLPPVIIELRGKSAAQLTATSGELGPVSKAGSQTLITVQATFISGKKADAMLCFGSRFLNV
ncbi:hypothetical protein N9D28_01770 [Luminiphilus sp.]|nr:hypothetical protein [Luminiphilus sp.]